MSPLQPPFPEPTQNADIVLIDLRKRLTYAQNLVRSYVQLTCPGEHRVTQHRDARPPWCNDCGRDNEGNLHREPKGKTND